MGNRSRVSFWHDIPNDVSIKASSQARCAGRLLRLLGKLFRTHDKNVVIWESGRPELGQFGHYYISKLEVCPRGKYD